MGFIRLLRNTGGNCIDRDYDIECFLAKFDWFTGPGGRRSVTILAWVIDTGQGGICLGPDGRNGILLLFALLFPLLSWKHCCFRSQRPKWAKYLSSMWISTYLWFSVSYLWKREARLLIPVLFQHYYYKRKKIL